MSAFPTIEQLIPHAEGMRLINRVVAEEDKTVRCEADIAESTIFHQPGRGVPGYVGFELMAQTISAYDGLRRHRSGKPPAIGFLVGCRSYRVSRPFFKSGERLIIEVTSLLGDEGMASFDCRILDAAGGELASGTINVYRPPDPEAFLNGR